MKAKVQAFNPAIVSDNEDQWVTLWTTNDYDKAAANARKRSIQYPNSLIRAVAGNLRLEEAFPTNYVDRVHYGRYFGAGEEFVYEQPTAYMGEAATTKNDKWQAYMYGKFDAWANQIGQEALRIQTEQWDTSRAAPMGEWRLFSRAWDYTNILTAESQLKNRRVASWRHSPGSDLTRVTYFNGDDVVRTDYWYDHKKITQEEVDSLIKSRQSFVAWQQQRIVQTSPVGGVYLSADMLSAFQTVGLSGAHRRFGKWAKGLDAVTKHGVLNDDQHERLAVATALMQTMTSLMDEEIPLDIPLDKLASLIRDARS